MIVNPQVKALLPFDMSAVDAVVAGEAADPQDPVFKKGSLENQAARAQAEKDMLSEKSANAQTFRELNDASEAKRKERIKALGGAAVGGGDFGGAGANKI